MTPYYQRRVVSWVAYHIRRGADMAGVLAANAKRRPPFIEEMIAAAYPAALAACKNAASFGDCGPDCRVCDIPGIKLPNED